MKWFTFSHSTFFWNPKYCCADLLSSEFHPKMTERPKCQFSIFNYFLLGECCTNRGNQSVGHQTQENGRPRCYDFWRPSTSKPRAQIRGHCQGQDAIPCHNCATGLWKLQAKFFQKQHFCAVDIYFCITNILFLANFLN